MEDGSLVTSHQEQQRPWPPKNQRTESSSTSRESKDAGLTVLELLDNIEYWIKYDLTAEMTSPAGKDAVQYLKNNVTFFRNHLSDMNGLDKKIFQLDASKFKQIAYTLALEETRRPNSYPNNEAESRKTFLKILTRETRTPDEAAEARRGTEAKQKPKPKTPNPPQKPLPPDFANVWM